MIDLVFSRIEFLICRVVKLAGYAIVRANPKGHRFYIAKRVSPSREIMSIWTPWIPGYLMSRFESSEKEYTQERIAYHAGRLIHDFGERAEVVAEVLCRTNAETVQRLTADEVRKLVSNYHVGPHREISNKVLRREVIKMLSLQIK